MSASRRQLDNLLICTAFNDIRKFGLDIEMKHEIVLGKSVRSISRLDRSEHDWYLQGDDVKFLAFMVHGASLAQLQQRLYNYVPKIEIEPLTITDSQIQRNVFEYRARSFAACNARVLIEEEEESRKPQDIDYLHDLFRRGWIHKFHNFASTYRPLLPPYYPGLDAEPLRAWADHVLDEYWAACKLVDTEDSYGFLAPRKLATRDAGIKVWASAVSNGREELHIHAFHCAKV